LWFFGLLERWASQVRIADWFAAPNGDLLRKGHPACRDAVRWRGAGSDVEKRLRRGREKPDIELGVEEKRRCKKNTFYRSLDIVRWRSSAGQQIVERYIADGKKPLI
jgi:hypothetical protein